MPKAYIAICGLFMSLTSLVVGLRLYSRAYLKSNASWDDSSIVLSQAVYIAGSITSLIATNKGLGHHGADLSPQALLETNKWLLITSAVGLFQFTLPKLSVALLLSRILTIGNALTRRNVLLCTPAIVLVLWSCAALVFWLTQCSPFEANWNKQTVGARCLNPIIFADFSTALGACSAAGDFFYALFPITVIARLQISRQQKIHISAMLGLGMIGGAFAIWKTVASRAITNPRTDITYDALPLLYSNAIESGVLIIAACIPTISPAIQEIFGLVSRSVTLVTTQRGFSQISGDTQARMASIKSTSLKAVHTESEHELSSFSAA